MAQRLPGWVTSDMLTYLGVAGAVICAVGLSWETSTSIIFGYRRWALLSIGLATALTAR